MAQETLISEPRELKFGGEGKAESIKRGFVITTLRNPKPTYNFSKGELITANCFDDNEKVSVVVISNETKNLNNFSIPQLALDGFFSAEHTIDGMKEYPGYENINKNSPIQAITFIEQKSFNNLSENLKKEVLNKNFDDLIKNQELRHLFFPTMSYWIAELGLGGLKNWVDFLYFNHLIGNEVKSYIQNYKVERTNVFRFFGNSSKLLKELSTDPNSTLFRPLILGLAK